MEFEIKTIEVFLRQEIGEWQEYSRKICGYKCLITGERFEVIHHKYPFYKILLEVFDETRIERKSNLEEYSDTDLQMLKEKCLEVHFKYGAGACLTDSIHKELHNTFGNNITIEHFEKFLYCKQNNINILGLDNIFKKTVKASIKKEQDIMKEIEREKLNEIKSNHMSVLMDNLDFIRSDEFKEMCPLTYYNIKRNIRYLEELLLIAIENNDSSLYYDNNENIIFTASNSYICKRLGLSVNSSTEVSNKFASFCYHKLINKISTEDTPKQIMTVSNIHNSNKKGYHYIGCYSIPSYKKLFLLFESQAKQWKLNNYSMRGISFEMFYRREGYEIASKIYPQIKTFLDKDSQQVVDRTTTSKSDLRTNKIVEIIFDILRTRDYVMEKEIIDELSADGDIKTSKKEAEKQVKKSMQEILIAYGLKRIRCNKLIKEKYNVNSEGYPFLIVKE